MKKQSYTFILAALIIATLTFAQKSASSNAQGWEKVNQLAQKQLPESALKEVESILKLAQKEKNGSETIKALVHKMGFTLEKNPDKAPDLIGEFERFTNNSTDPSERALLHSLTAELYEQYYHRDSYNINRRTNLENIIPQDIKEWTRNLFFNKIAQHLAASMEDAKALQNSDALKYAALLKEGIDSRTLQPTLYDFLAYRRISILETVAETTNITNPLEDKRLFAEIPLFITLQLDSTYRASIQNHIVKTYQELLDFRSKANNVSALLFADLKRLKYFNEHSEIEKDSLYLSALNRIKKQYNNNDVVIEVMAEIANFYLEHYNNTENSNYKKLAFDECTCGILHFPSYNRIEILKDIQRKIETKNLNITYNSITKPNNNIDLKVNSQNIPSVQLTVYKVNASAEAYYIFKQNEQNRMTIYPNRSLIYTRKIDINPDPNFGFVNTSVDTKVDEFGIYEFCIEENGNTKNENKTFGTFTSTDLATIERCTETSNGSLYVLDRQSGTPVSEVTISRLNRKWTKQGYAFVPEKQFITDIYGFCKFPLGVDKSNQVFFFQKGKDRFYSSESQSYYWENKEQEDKVTGISIFTDRSIYRPGQTVYFKAIAYYSDKANQHTIAGAIFDFSLIDANGHTVTKKSLKTNEFGSVSGQFALPNAGLNGTYSIRTGYFSKEISVEEYKRPNFEVKIEKPKAEVSFGEELMLKGNVKAFAAYGIANASVKYRILRRTHHYCWWLNVDEKEISHGTTVSNADGSFELKFTPTKTNDKFAKINNRQIYTYTISVDVTDTKGETEQGEQSFSVGEQSLFILSEIDKKIDKHQTLSLPISTETLNGDKVNSLIMYSVVKLEEADVYNEKLNDKTVIKELKTVISGDFECKNKQLYLDLSKCKTGRYKLILATKDARGRAVKTEQIFILYDLKDSRPPVKTYVWSLCSKKECKVGETTKINFGTSTKNSAVLYELMFGNTVLESKWISFSDEIKSFEIPFKATYGSGINVQFTFMKDEQLFTELIELKRTVTEKKLTPTLSVFRDKLQPGEKVEWTVTVPEAAKNKQAIELMASMYDASLNTLRPIDWSFSPVYQEPILYSPLWINRESRNRTDQISWMEDGISAKEFKFDQLNWFGFGLNRYNSINSYKRNGRFRGPIIVKGEEMTEQIQVKAIVSDVKGYTELSAPSRKNSNLIKPRTNFNETAFFYPQLRTDSLGNVKFSFTVPESLTRWNVKMLAHTKDLYFGQGEAQVVTQKDLMVQMNLPRFVRRSDKLVLSANVINLTDKELNTNVQFEMIDPATEKPIQLKDAAAKKVILASNETKTVEWELTEFSPYELVSCKLIAQAGSFSDGEQKYLPVLPDKVLVTESMPLVLRGNETRTFNFENLLQNGSKVDNKSLTVEFSSNPTWYAIQALPTLSTPEGDNAFDYLTAYYANRLAGYIANSNPKIKSIFEQWKREGGSRDALLSNLDQNAELKNILLEETTWVMAAKNESEQKRQIALLFDLNAQENQAQQYLDKLKALQLPSGGFAWYKGMGESRYVTQAILLNLGRLKKMVNGQRSTDNGSPIVMTALAYLDLEIAKDFENLKKYSKNYEKEHSIDNIQLFYLHLRSEFPEIAIEESAKEAVQFYTLQSEKCWTNFSLYGKAIMAVVAQRNGKVEIANNILKSLKENALKTDELGMYWDKNQAGYFWNERPIAVQTAMIEAFAEISKNQGDVEELKLWLLKQKQTQCWDSPLSSADAIYALLQYGSDWLANEGNVKIKLGSTLVKSQSTEAGTGYFKQTIPTADIQSSMGKVTVSSADLTNQSQPMNTGKVNRSSIGWGAIYWQYYQNLENITKQIGVLSVSKKLYLEKMSIQGKQLLPIEQKEIKKGDKVITRLVVTTDRNLDFVALKDLRAACFEPVEQISGCFWKEGVCYYKTAKDASTQFFFSHLPKGTYVFEYELWANSTGNFTSGMASVQCLYAPEFVSHSSGERIVVK